MTQEAQCQQCEAGHSKGRNKGQTLYNTPKGSRLTTTTEEETPAVLWL